MKPHIFYAFVEQIYEGMAWIRSAYVDQWPGPVLYDCTLSDGTYIGQLLVLSNAYCPSVPGVSHCITNWLKLTQFTNALWSISTVEVEANEKAVSPLQLAKAEEPIN